MLGLCTVVVCDAVSLHKCSLKDCMSVFDRQNTIQPDPCNAGTLKAVMGDQDSGVYSPGYFSAGPFFYARFPALEGVL